LHGASALIGNFDGMHRGHCGIIRTVVAEADLAKEQKKMAKAKAKA
jgi:FAD synthase